MPLICKICKSPVDVFINLTSDDWKAFQNCNCTESIRIDNEVTIRFLVVGKEKK